jgi:hypothetical protein
MTINYHIVPNVLSQYAKRLTDLSELLFTLIRKESINSHSKLSLDFKENTPFFYITKSK